MYKLFFKTQVNHINTYNSQVKTGYWQCVCVITDYIGNRLLELRDTRNKWKVQNKFLSTVEFDPNPIYPLISRTRYPLRHESGMEVNSQR